MTTVNSGVYNPATKQTKVISRTKVTFARKHGRPRNVKKIAKFRRLEVTR